MKNETVFDSLCLEGLEHYYQYDGSDNGMETFVCAFCGDLKQQFIDAQP